MPHRSPPPEIPTPRSVWRRVWDYVEEPKSVTLVQALAVYLVGIVGGVLSFYMPPSTTNAILGDFWVTAVSSLMVIGGSIGVVTSLIGWWWIERPLGVGFLLVGLLLYIYSVAEAQVISDGSRWLQLSWLIIAAGGLIIRWLRIRKANYDPLVV